MSIYKMLTLRRHEKKVYSLRCGGVCGSSRLLGRLQKHLASKTRRDNGKQIQKNISKGNPRLQWKTQGIPFERFSELIIIFQETDNKMKKTKANSKCKIFNVICNSVVRTP